LPLYLILILPSGDKQDKSAQQLSSLELADAFLSKGEYAKAIEELSWAAEAGPDNAEVFYRLGLAYIGNDQLAEAITNFTQAIILNPEHAKSYTQRALVYNTQYEHEKALYQRKFRTTEGENITYSAQESMVALPGSIASHEIMWLLISQRGTIEIISGDNIAQVPFTIGHAIRPTFAPYHQ
jgi:tetratricopeptide (TPR) repeat protein